MLERRRAERHMLVTAAHLFAISVVPLRHPHSARALRSFVEHLPACALPSADVDAVLLRALAVLDPYCGHRLPSLIDRYLSGRRIGRTASDAFSSCVHDAIRYRGIGDAVVQRAVDTIQERYVDPNLTEAGAAKELDVMPHELSLRFKTATGVTWSEYRRGLRLDRAAHDLLATSKSIKEIWVGAGYNDASNFCHDFRVHFGLSPTGFRRRGMLSDGARPGCTTDDASAPDNAAPSRLPLERRTVLVADDDHETLRTVSRFLQIEGFAVRAAASGAAALIQYRQGQFSAALLDYHMPDMTGVDCLRAMRGDAPSKVPAVAIVTADWEIELDDPEIRALGALVVPKLCALSDISQLVTSLCAMWHIPT